VVVCFVDIGGIVDHHSFRGVVCFFDIGGIVDHHSLENSLNSIKTTKYDVLSFK
jgi:inorganic pyrophosphatase/exopolyphosphatase